MEDNAVHDLPPHIHAGPPCRLDHALAQLLPDLGLRGRRRLIQRGAVLVMGHPRPAAHVVRTGDELRIVQPCSPENAPNAGTGMEFQPFLAEEARLIAQRGGFCFLAKPAGLHSVALAGGEGHSLEELLPRLMQKADTATAGTASPELLQRLDRGTSGIVTAALRPALAQAWRDAEDRGLCRKRYLALLSGRLPAERTLRLALDMRRRKRTRVLDTDAAPLRHTCFTPLLHLDGPAAATLRERLAPENPAVPALTLAGCTIRKGARHQIRAHAAALGLPLWGDALYGGGSGRFLLHHGGLDFPGQHIVLLPVWSTCFPPQTQAFLRRWLDTGAI